MIQIYKSNFSNLKLLQWFALFKTLNSLSFKAFIPYKQAFQPLLCIFLETNAKPQPYIKQQKSINNWVSVHFHSNNPFVYLYIHISKPPDLHLCLQIHSLFPPIQFSLVQIHKHKERFTKYTFTLLNYRNINLNKCKH